MEAKIYECILKNKLDEALLFACQTNRLDIIRMLVREYDAKLTSGCLIEAALFGDLDIVKFIVEHNVDVNQKRYGISPLFAAIIGGKKPIVQFLCEAGAEISNDCIFKSPESNIDILRYILSKGEAYFSPFTLGLLLIIACQNGIFENVDYLVSKGANVHIEDDLPVQEASACGDLKIVKYLVIAGANIRTSNDLALRRSCSERNFEVVRYLCEAGADRSVISPEAERYLQLYERTRVRAQKKIYFWWIPICYDTRRDCGKRMMIRNWEATKELFDTQ